uniref:Small ribosomal subunit protein mS29 n=1 Tax=Simocephalus serrulatus TaxID=117539 RepID=A0A4Y7NNQ7_9CRUS|nr:EOG090X05V1 [Simocephalus serrulatus]SVE94226.1 EOG090X05V1 [Simocephalus serrulatus]
MIRYGRVFDVVRSLRRFSSVATDFVPVSESLTDAVIFRTSETNPANHSKDQDGRFYRVPDSIKKQLFTHGGLPKEYNILSETLNELCIMVRKPTVELIDYLKKTNFDAPVPRYVLYGNTGTGKSLSLAHILHYGSNAGFVLVHVPWVPNWFRKFKEVAPSVMNPNKYDHPIEAVEWLRHFVTQNGPLFPNLGLKTTSTYTWSKREITAEGAPLSELIDLGLNRAKYATSCIAALLDELKKAAVNNQCRVLVVIDGFNSFFSPRSRATREDKSVVLPSDFVVTEAFLSITKNDWNNGAVVVSVDPVAHPNELRESYLPRYQLGKQGFEHLDPFVPIEMPNYNEKEFRSQIDYYIERKWLQQPKAHTEKGRTELSFTSGNHPYSLMRLVAPY